MFSPSRRMAHVPQSFIREILKVTQKPEVISFAGGLPDPECFPAQAIREAASRAIGRHSARILQYAPTEGLLELRQWIAQRYQRFGLSLGPENVLITTGSQQALDLLGKILLNPGDTVLVEHPSYLGAIQAFCLFEARFATAPLTPRGVDVAAVQRELQRGVRLFYTIPNFHNPTGISADASTRQALARLMAEYPQTLLVEDDPYGELRFRGPEIPPIFAATHGASIHLGSFSKILAPGLRVGWMAGPPEIIRAAATAKQAADLHTSTVCQAVILQLLEDGFPLPAHIQRVCAHYGERAQAMIHALRHAAPQGTRFTEPEGGMFLWLSLPPQGPTSMELFHAAMEKNIAFVPGAPFFLDGGGAHAARLNFTAASSERIRQGILRLCQCLADLLQAHSKAPAGAERRQHPQP